MSCKTHRKNTNSGDGIRTALVTGAAGSIGRAVSRYFLDNGHRTILVDCNVQPLEKICEEAGGHAIAKICDLAEPRDIDDLCAAIESDFGGIDILINNAGILSSNKLGNTDFEEWRRVHQVNLDAAFLLTRHFLPYMRRMRWGRIVNISSYAAKSGGLTAGTAYTVSKSALHGLTFSTAREVAGEGVTANAIAPAYVNSPMITAGLTEAQRTELLGEIPVGRFCEPAEVAHAVGFLASPRSGFITGEIIDMNGGLHFD